MKAKILGFLAVGLLAGPMAANAIPVKWVVDIETTDGGMVNGSFVYDAGTNVFSKVMVSATGFPFPPESANLTSYLPGFSGSTTVDLVPSVADLTGKQDVYLVLAASMTDAGGVINIGELQTYTCDNADCSLFTGLYGTSSFVGAATISSVPEPGTLALLGLGLAGLGLSRKRRK